MENGAKMNFILNGFQMKCNIFTVSLEKLILNTCRYNEKPKYKA